MNSANNCSVVNDNRLYDPRPKGGIFLACVIDAVAWVDSNPIERTSQYNSKPYNRDSNPVSAHEDSDYS